jgi:hypothetical protein
MVRAAPRTADVTNRVRCHGVSPQLRDTSPLDRLTEV